MAETHIHPTAIIEDGAQLGEGVRVGPYCMIGEHAKIGPGTVLHSHVVVTGRTEVGAECQLHPFVVLGDVPQHNGYKGEETTLIVGDRNRIREHVTMQRGTVQGGGVTKVGSDSLFMVGAHVAHDCILGDGVTMANNATLAGHITIGDFVFISGLCAIHQFSRIGSYAFLAGGAILTTDLIPFGMAAGNRAVLEGLNLTGLKRRGFDRPTIHALRGAYRDIFTGDGRFADRVTAASEKYAGQGEVQCVLDFITAEDARPICLPAG